MSTAIRSEILLSPDLLCKSTYRELYDFICKGLNINLPLFDMIEYFNSTIIRRSESSKQSTYVCRYNGTSISISMIDNGMFDYGV